MLSNSCQLPIWKNPSIPVSLGLRFALPIGIAFLGFHFVFFLLGHRKKLLLPGIYGLITAVIINGKMDAANYSAYSGPESVDAGDICWCFQTSGEFRNHPGMVLKTCHKWWDKLNYQTSTDEFFCRQSTVCCDLSHLWFLFECQRKESSWKGYAHLGAGLTVGMSCLAGDMPWK